MVALTIDIFYYIIWLITCGMFCRACLPLSSCHLRVRREPANARFRGNPMLEVDEVTQLRSGCEWHELRPGFCASLAQIRELDLPFRTIISESGDPSSDLPRMSAEPNIDAAQPKFITKLIYQSTIIDMPDGTSIYAAEVLVKERIKVNLGFGAFTRRSSDFAGSQAVAPAQLEPPETLQVYVQPEASNSREVCEVVLNDAEDSPLLQPNVRVMVEDC